MPVKLDRVYNQDCLKGLAKLDAVSVDLAFADPPFNIGYDYDVYDDRKGYDEYLDWTRAWTAAVTRVLKDDGSFWVAIGDEYAAEMKLILQNDCKLICRNWVIWYYTFGVHCKYKFTRSHAHLFYFVKHPKKFTFNADDIRVPSARQLVYGDKRAESKGRLPDDTWVMMDEGAGGEAQEVDKAQGTGHKAQEEGKKVTRQRGNEAVGKNGDEGAHKATVAMKDGFVLRPQDMPDGFGPEGDTWYYSRVAGTFKERRGFHGCQMPEQLLGRIIRACSNPGEVVLDPFAGSGTTPTVAKKLGRRYLGFDISDKYVKQVNERLKAVKTDDALVGPADPVASAPRTSEGTIRVNGKRIRANKKAEPRNEGPALFDSLTA